MSPNLPDLKQLFGELSFCKCQDCNSIYSPAAYLVDLLHSLLETKITAVLANKNIVTGTAILESRRPDITNLQLTCSNTNTPLPYIDLVNEILENAIQPPKAFPQTQGTAEELAASPEHMNDAVYDATNPKTPAGAVYPWLLPFDLPAEVTRRNLEQTDLSRAELMRALRHRSEPIEKNDAAALTDVAIAQESLELTRRERDIITNQPLNPPRDPWEFWGYPDTALANPDQPKNAWINDKADGLDNVSIFLAKSGLEYGDVLDLLASPFINPRGAITVQGPDAKCDISKMTLQGLSPEALSRIHRFVRLQRKLGWTTADLCLAIRTLARPKPEITDSFLVRLTHVRSLQSAARLPVRRMLSWWSATLDTRPDRQSGKSVYEEIFENKTVVRSPNDPFALLQPGRNELQVTGKISDNPTPVLAALGINASELAQILQNGDATNDLNLNNLSKLYALVSFARSLRLSIKDFLAIESLTGIKPIQPFDDQNPDDATQPAFDSTRFTKEVARIRASGLAVPETIYLLQGVASPGIDSIKAADLAALLLELRDGLKKVAADNLVGTDPNGDSVRKKLASVLSADGSPSAVDLAMLLLGDVPSNTPADQQVVAKYFPNDAAKKKFIQDNFAAFIDPATAIAQLVGGPLTAAEARYEFVLKPLAAYLRRTQSESLVKDKVSSALNAGKAPTARLETAVVDKLLTGGETASGAVASTANGALPAIADFLPLDDIDLDNWSSGVDLFAKKPQKFLDGPAKFIQDAGLGPAPFARLQNQLPTLLVLYRTALILSRLRIALDELPWMLKDGLRIGWKGWLDPNQLPPRGAFTYTSWRRLQDVIALRDALPDGALGAVIAKADDKQAIQDDVFAIFRNLLNWGTDDLKNVTAQPVLNLQFPADFLDERTLLLLTQAFEVLGQLRVSAKSALEWVGPDVTAKNARDIGGAVKSNFDDAAWLKIAKTVQDVLREKRRAALVAFLIGNRSVIAGQEFLAPGDLFDYFLVDVEMSACQTTTRLVLAMFSVQLFIQRCLMNLETFPDNGARVTVHVDPDGVRWWQGMQNFRLWQAGRQVFAHPENWVDPRLLDNRTPFFAELQNQLLQDDLTWGSAEEAINGYVSKVMEIARLEVVGHYHEAPVDNESADVVHVVGRTWALPRVYYYRKRVSLGGSTSWTAWEKIDADVDAARLLPIIWHRRLYLFWPVFTGKAEDQDLDASKPIPKPKKYWEIRLAWSEYKNSKWSPKKTSGGVLAAKGEDYAEIQPSATNYFYFFRGQFTDDQHEQLVVKCLAGNFQRRVGSFVFNGCEADPLIADFADAQLVHDYNKMYEFEYDSEFITSLAVGTLDSTKTGDSAPEYVLGHVLPQYKVRFPHQYDQFYSQDVFFYLDDGQDMFVEPSEYVPSKNWSLAQEASPGWLQNMDRIKADAFKGMVTTQS